MKITMLSEIDYAGSGHKLCEAIRKNTKHDIEIFTGRYYNPYRHPDNSKWNPRQVQQIINDSDIVHLKGDWPPKNGYLGMNILHKPIVVTVSGSHFRKKKYGGHEKFDIQEYSCATVRTAFTPDLCYEDFIWTPHPIDAERVKIEWFNGSPQMLHMPSRPEVKGAEFIKQVFSELEKKGIKCLITSNVSHAESVRLKQQATIYFDQFEVGFYGNSAIEAMQHGIPVAAWLDVDMPECPVITERKGDVDAWVKRILTILGGDMKIDSVESRFWCLGTHSYKAVAKQWDEIYNNIN